MNVERKPGLSLLACQGWVRTGEGDTAELQPRFHTKAVPVSPVARLLSGGGVYFIKS